MPARKRRQKPEPTVRTIPVKIVTWTERLVIPKGKITTTPLFEFANSKRKGESGQ